MKWRIEWKSGASDQIEAPDYPAALAKAKKLRRIMRSRFVHLVPVFGRV